MIPIQGGSGRGLGFRPLRMRSRSTGEQIPIEQRGGEPVRFALGASGIAVWELDIGSGSVTLSESWSVMLGEAPQETRTSLQLLMALVHPDDLENATRRAMEAVKGERATYAV